MLSIVNKKSLLIVEDDCGVQEAFEAAFEDKYNLRIVDNGEEAFELIFFFGEMHDLIITDIVLPGIDGLNLIKKIREVNPWIPILIITGYSTLDRAEEAANLFISGYINKPIDIFDLENKIKDLLHAKSSIPYYPPLNLLLNHSTTKFHSVTIRTLQEIHKKFHIRLSIEDLAVAVGVSVFHLCKIFKEDCGITLNDYLNRLRLEVTKRLLKNSRYTISHIMELVGFRSRTYFFKLFKMLTGETPEQFRTNSIDKNKRGLGYHDLKPVLVSGMIIFSGITVLLQMFLD